ncbi:MAG: hypothetical protein ACRDZ8_14770 [Acidimicrobiales bacterium]
MTGRKTARLLFFGAVVAGGFGLGTPAWSQTSGGTYTGVTPPQLSAQQTGTAQVRAATVTTTDAHSSGLAVTGTDALELAAIGLILVGAGTALQCSVRVRRSS